MTIEDLIGIGVRHPKYGSGKIIANEKGNMQIRFASKIAIFPFPDSFGKGFLRIEDDEVLQNLLEKQAKEYEIAKREAEEAERNKVQHATKLTEHRDSIQTGIYFATHAEAINECMGTEYKQYQRAYKAFPEKGIAFWFPSIARRVMGTYVAADSSQGWLNILAENDTVLYEKHSEDTEKNKTWYDRLNRLVFAKFDEEDVYRFIGVFRQDEYSEEKGFKFIRIGTKIDLNSMEVFG